VDLGSVGGVVLPAFDLSEVNQHPILALEGLSAVRAEPSDRLGLPLLGVVDFDLLRPDLVQILEV